MDATNNALAAGVVATINPLAIGAMHSIANDVPFEPEMFLYLLTCIIGLATAKWDRRSLRDQGLSPVAVGLTRKVVEWFPSASDLSNKWQQWRLAGPATTFIRIFPTSNDFVRFLLDSIVMAINQDPRLLTWIGSQSQETLENMAEKIVSNVSTSLRSDSIFCDLGLKRFYHMFVNRAARIVKEAFAISSSPVNQVPQQNNVTNNPTLPAPSANDDEALLKLVPTHQTTNRLMLLVNILPYKQQAAIVIDLVILLFVSSYLANTVLPIDHFSYLAQPAY